MNKSELIFVAAVEEELAPLRTLVGNNTRVQFLVSGIGVVAATAAVANFLATHQMRSPFLVFVGSSGSYDSNIPLLSLASVSRTKLVDRETLSEKAEFPTPMVQELVADKAGVGMLSGLLPDILEERVATTLAITRDPQLARALMAHTGCRLENLELFGVASACAQHRTPWASLTCVTNYVAPNGHKEWADNRFKAAQQTADALKELFGA